MYVVVRVLLVLVGLLLIQRGLGAEDHFFVSDGVRIRYIEQGTGEPVVLVHGFTNSINDWIGSGVLPNLARDYRVIALDLRGHGQSEKPHDASMYGERMALDVIHLMDHLGVAKAHVIGYSQGARIVGYLLTTHPSRFSSATLGGSPPRVGWPSAEAARAEQDAQAMEQRSKSGVSDGQDYIALAAVARSRSTQVVTEARLRQVAVPTIGIVGSEDPRMAGMKALMLTMPACCVSSSSMALTTTKPRDGQSLSAPCASFWIRRRSAGELRRSRRPNNALHQTGADDMVSAGR